MNRTAKFWGVASLNLRHSFYVGQRFLDWLFV